MPNITIAKILTAPSSTAVGSVSSAATPVITFITSNFSTQRRLSLWSSVVALSSQWSMTISGTREGGWPISETITPSTVVGTPNVTTQDFLSVTGITTLNSTPDTSKVNIGLSSIGSTPWQIANTCATPFNIGFNLVYSSSNATTTAEVDYTGQDISPIFTGGSFVPSIFSISTAISTTGNSTAGKIDFPITAWRMTVNSTNSSTSSGVTVYAIPAGLGS